MLARSGPPKQIRQLPGELCAAIFQCFEDGEPLAAIVIKCKVDPEVVRALYEEYVVALEEGHQRLDRMRGIARERHARLRQNKRDAAQARAEERELAKLAGIEPPPGGEGDAYIPKWKRDGKGKPGRKPLPPGEKSGRVTNKNGSYSIGVNAPTVPEEPTEG